MFQCKSCGGGLRFDVATQQMHCDYCGQSYDPYSYTGAGSADENIDSDFDVTLFTCPACGAQLGGVETSAAEFCSYCGSSVVLESRLSKMKRPKYVIPFKQTKENCTASLAQRLKSAFFVASDFKNSEVDSFRGIYMPYWNYKVTQQGKVTLHGSKFSHSKGDYDYYDNYVIKADLDANYDGIPHDASNAFADRISEALEPYNYKTRKPFTPGFLAGFFADIQDVSPDKYQADAVKLANQRTFNTLVSKIDFEESDLKEKSDDKKIDDLLHTKLEETDCTMVPVWFLSYRKNNRVAYAAVNGETGKVVSDMPLDFKKIWAMIPILAIPIFLLLNMFLSMTAGMILLISIAALGIAGFIYWLELYLIADHEKNVNTDRASKRDSKKIKKDVAKENKTTTKKQKGILSLAGNLLCLLFIVFVAISVLADVAGVALIVIVALPFICAVAMPIIGIYQCKKKSIVIESSQTVKDIAGFIFLLFATVLDVLIFLFAPAADTYYYAGTILGLVAILYTISRIIVVYNIFTTRPLPQFTQRGVKGHGK